MGMIPIVRRYEDKKEYEGLTWREGELHTYFLYYYDKPILKTWKTWMKRVIEHKNNEGRIISRSLTDDTLMIVYDMRGNELDKKVIKIIYAHNRPDDELPQVEDMSCVKEMIRKVKIDKVVEI